MVDKKFIKQTLNMPKTDFSMKANLQEKEKFYRIFWNKKKIYEHALEKNSQNPRYIVHDGPPYANGKIHLGHALNKILKDFVVRYKTMQGFYSPFVAGWDTHGLPIENKMLQELNLKHQEIDVVFLRKKAKKYALKQVENQKKQFLELQLFSDLEKKYLTLDHAYEANQIRLFKKMFQEGLIYKGLKPVFWSPSSLSALAEAEVEYKDHDSPSLYLKFKIYNSDLKDLQQKAFLVIWTTTPWTLIANSAVVVNPDFYYLIVEYQNEKFVVQEDLFTEKLQKIFQWKETKILQKFLGKKLEKTFYFRPIKEKKISQIYCAEHVTKKDGSGLVHTAPLFGEDDFLVSKKYNLEEIMHVKDDGFLNEEAEIFAGTFYLDANLKIIEFLNQKNLVIFEGKIRNRYPYDWRTNKPIIFRGTPQWFFSIKKIKKQIFTAIEQIHFFNDWSKNRLTKMMTSRDTWTISRQRSWGVPIPVFYNEKKEIVNDKDIFDYFIKRIEKEGTDIWFSEKTDSLLAEKFRNKNFSKEQDIMDVWFDSGSSSICIDYLGLEGPFDLYLEGSDQYRGWFNSSLINSVVFRNKSPYKNLLSHGFVVDEKGNKMSKSKGNVLDPLEIVKKYGADILRMWVANSEYTQDLSISENIINQNVEIYRKIRNTVRFLLGNLENYQHEKTELKGVHLLINEKLENFKFKVNNFMEKFHFIGVIKEINNFIIDVSNFYFSITKDVLYTYEIDHLERKQILFNFYNILENLTIMIAPFLPTTAEEIYSFLPKKNKKISVHLENFIDQGNQDKKIQNKWKEFFEIKDTIYKKIEEKIKNKKIKRSNEAHVFIDEKASEWIKNLDLKNLLMVGKVSFAKNYDVKIFTNSFKCERCWNLFENSEKKDNFYCLKCYKIIKKISTT